MSGWKTEAYSERGRAFGWHAIEIDGHNLDEINQAYGQAVDNVDSPTVIVALTVKGKGVASLEDVGG